MHDEENFALVLILGFIMNLIELSTSGSKYPSPVLHAHYSLEDVNHEYAYASLLMVPPHPKPKPDDQDIGHHEWM